MVNDDTSANDRYTIELMLMSDTVIGNEKGHPTIDKTFVG